MVQELVASFLEERKLSISDGELLSDTPSPFLSSTSTANLPPSASAEPPQQNLRCPRCDSSNTKFCYYNNYNLTQPRHFCKTCRRYWTKGGALRNIPIGGGCRKTKLGSAISATAAGGKPGSGSNPTKPIPFQDPIARAGFGFAPELSLQNPALWAASPPQDRQHTSHLLALLGVGGGFEEESMAGEPGLPGLGMDPLGQFMGCQWRNEGQNINIPYSQQQNDAPHELYQCLQSSTATAYCNDHLIRSNCWSPPECSSSIATSAPIAAGSGGGGRGSSVAAIEPVLGGEFGYWNSLLSWSDMSTTN